MKKSLFAALALTGALLTATSPLQAEEVTWTGCGITKKAFMAEIATAYEKKTGIPVKLSGGGATKGIRSVSAGASDMGGTCRHALKEADGIHAEEKDAVLTQVAWDALVVIAHPENPVNDISMENLKKVYDGTITNWNELGGPDKRIVLVTRDGKYSGVGHMFRMLAYNDKEHEFQARSLKVKSTGPLEKKVEKTVTALGMDGISSAKKRELKFLSIDGIAPTKDNIANGSYPLFRPLYLAVNKGGNPKAQAVVDFVLSPEGQAIISAQGTVNLEEGKALNTIWAGKKAAMGL